MDIPEDREDPAYEAAKKSSVHFSEETMTAEQKEMREKARKERAEKSRERLDRYKRRMERSNLPPPEPAADPAKPDSVDEQRPSWISDINPDIFTAGQRDVLEKMFSKQTLIQRFNLGIEERKAMHADMMVQFNQETMTPDQKKEIVSFFIKRGEWDAKKREEKEERGPTKPQAPDPAVQAKRLRRHAKQREMWTGIYRDAAPKLDGVIASPLGPGDKLHGGGPIRRLLLGREPYEYDEMIFMHKAIGSDTDDEGYMKTLDHHYQKYPYQLFKSPAVCKWFLCDRRVPPRRGYLGHRRPVRGAAPARGRERRYREGEGVREGCDRPDPAAPGQDVSCGVRGGRHAWRRARPKGSVGGLQAEAGAVDTRHRR